MRPRFPLPVLLLLVTIAPANEIRVAAAADLNYAFRDIAARFEKQTENKADVYKHGTTRSSG